MYICIMLTFYSHLSGGVFWRSHPCSFFEPSAERLVDANTRIGRRPCKRNNKGDMTGVQGSLEGHVYKRLRLCLPKEKISQRRTPKDQTSLCVVYTRSNMVSGAIHFRGRRACSKEEHFIASRAPNSVQQSTHQCSGLTSPLRT